MLDRCKQFGLFHGLRSKAKKTLRAEFHDSAKFPVLTEYDVQMGTKLQWVNRVKHLGHTFEYRANFDANI